jgi:hypothetical protein
VLGGLIKKITGVCITLQVAVIEEALRMLPAHGFIVCGDSTRRWIENTAELLAWELGVAMQIRAARAAANQRIPVNPKPAQCRPRGMRKHCTHARTEGIAAQAVLTQTARYGLSAPRL